MKLATLVFTLFFALSTFATIPENCPCKADLDKFCKDVKTHAEHKKCLEEHKTELSKECQDNMGKCCDEAQCPMAKKGKGKGKKKADCGKQCPMKKKMEEEAKKEETTKE